MKTQLQAVILDDMPIAGEELKSLLEEYYPEILVSGVFTEYNDAFAFIAETETDLVFLDIELNDKNGLDFYTLLQKLRFPLQCIIVSAYITDYHKDLLDKDLTLYIDKPVTPANLKKAMTKARRNIAENRYSNKITHVNPLDINRKVALMTDNGMIHIYPEELLYAQANGQHSLICLRNSGRMQKIKVSRRLGDLHHALNDPNIFRADKSWLVNITYLREIDEFSDSIIMAKSTGEMETITITGEGFSRIKALMKKTGNN